MLTVYRSNRAEILADLLATQLRLDPPGPLEQVEVVVNTWPTSRWLGEQLALGLGGIAANLRFPFPGSQMRRLVAAVLEEAEPAGVDPWRAQALVWPILELFVPLTEHPDGAPLRQWLQQRGGPPAALDLARWQLARAIADAFDDYALYRPDVLAAWWQGQGQGWQPRLLALLRQRLGQEPFGLRVLRAITQLSHQPPPPGSLPPRLRLFGLSAMAPVQVQLLQALSGHMAVDLYLLTPCRDLWQRCTDRRQQLSDAVALQQPLDADWLLAAPGLEARFGRLGAEFQQLLEGTGEAQLGLQQDGDLFFAPATAAGLQGRQPTLLEQLQQRLLSDTSAADGAPLQRSMQDCSLEFHACPGRLRQLQIVRDRLLQLLAADPSLEPRDILLMTPQVEAFAPLVGAVFGDSDATGVPLPWRLTDRSQQSEAGLAQGLLQLLALGGERLTASALGELLACGPLLAAQGIASDEAGTIQALLQQAGFRWGLDGRSRGGDPTHSLSWALDRLLLGLVLPELPGLAPAETAPLAMQGSFEQQARWLQLLRQLLRSLRWLGQSRTPQAWVEGLRQQLSDLFADGGERAWELQAIYEALADWHAVAAGSTLELPAAVVAEVLAERLSEGSGRFGHRSGALTISALEPMRAIPHKVVVLFGLDAGSFPRRRERPGFHLLEQQRRLGDPSSGDQDRYVLLESLLSARQHLLLAWSCRDERSGERLEPATPVRQWLELLAQQLEPVPLREHAANPLERSNFLPQFPWPPASCDRRLLQARQTLERQLDRGGPALTGALAWSPAPAPVPPPEPPPSWSLLRDWMAAPQRCWLEQLGLRPREFEQPLQDLECLELPERQRASLLRSQLEASAPPDWALLERGRGQLPPLAAGALEVRHLAQRWTSLDACLRQLGEPHQQPAQWRQLEAELGWRGDHLVLVHTAKARTPQRLVLWLELLLACSAGQAPAGAALVARDQQRFRIVERIQPWPAEAAATQLELLLQWCSAHRTRCWPLPPETGWAFAAAEHSKPGQGLGKAQSIWEGGFRQSAERCEAVQALCFGADLSVAALLTPALQQLALELHQPLLARWQPCKP
ncbi:MAG: exodeoxyribonuclease V subunit gamma [Cyanobacteriota bacterium]|nr:exodeoxyribonuclease V subunit gamma [Cyanobacteriota bacterium]